MTRDAWPRLLAAYTMEQRARGIRPETIRTRMSYLRRFSAEHDPVVTRDTVITWLANDRWAPVLRRQVESYPPGFLFPGRFSGHLDRSTVARWMKAASGSSPHPFRHRFATRAYSGTKNLRGVQEALGHSSPDTTKVYILLADDALLDVMMAAA